MTVCEWNEGTDTECPTEAAFEIIASGQPDGASCAAHLGVYVAWLANDTDQPSIVTIRRLAA